MGPIWDSRMSASIVDLADFKRPRQQPIPAQRFADAREAFSEFADTRPILEGAMARQTAALTALPWMTRG